MAIYADLEGLFRTEQGRGLAPALLASVKEGGPDADGCMRRLIASARELASGTDDRGTLVIARFEHATGGQAPPLACVPSFLHGAPMNLAGAQQGFKYSDLVMAVTDEILLAGPQPLVEAALHVGKGAGWPSSVSLAGDQFGVWTITQPDQSGRGALSMTPQELRIAFDTNATTENDAIVLEQAIRAAAEAVEAPGLDAASVEVLSRIRRGIRVTRDKTHLSLSFEFKEPAAAQARDVGLVASALVSRVMGGRAEMAQLLGDLEKSQQRLEGEIVLAAIAAHWMVLRLDGKKSKLVSSPLVPKKPPTSSGYLASGEDWKGWVGFHWDKPLHFQYEIRAAKDGRTAQILAHGEIAGKASTLRMTLTTDRKTQLLTMGPVEEIDPTAASN